MCRLYTHITNNARWVAFLFQSNSFNTASQADPAMRVPCSTATHSSSHRDKPRHHPHRPAACVLGVRSPRQLSTCLKKRATVLLINTFELHIHNLGIKMWLWHFLLFARINPFVPWGVGETAFKSCFLWSGQARQVWPSVPPLPQARQGPHSPGSARRRHAPAGTGRPSLHSIVFLNAFMNNSERKYYSLAGGQGPAWCRSAGLGAAKANTLPALPQFSPVFQINRCSPAPVSRPGDRGPFVSNMAS